jgi:uncharacterized protein YuzE
MKFTYDREADAAYIQLADEILAGGVARSYPCDPNEAGMINLDFDDQDRLVGIEVLHAAGALPAELLNQDS